MTIAIEKLAQKSLGHFGNRDGRVVKRKDAPEWIQNLIYEVHEHGNILPDDFKYKFILDAIDSIADGDTDDRWVEGDIYTGDLLDWFVFDVSKIGYVNDAVEENGYPGDIIEAIRMGQLKERLEIFNIVLAALELELDEEEEE